MAKLIEEEIIITVNWGTRYLLENDDTYTLVQSFTIGRLKNKLYEIYGIKVDKQRILGRKNGSIEFKVMQDE